MEQINCTTVVSPLHADQKIEETAEGRMVIRNVVDKEQQGKFDEWYNGKAYKITTASETRIGKPMNWDSRKSAQCWNFFSQGAMETDGRPVVRCLICGEVLTHGSLYGPTTMKTHLKSVGHMKKATEMIHGLEGGGKQPTEEEVLGYLKRSGMDGMVV